MLMALEEDRLCQPNQVPVGYINAHATSTPKGDQIEAAVVNRVLQSMSDNTNSTCYLNSTKGQSGHLLGAAGALEAAFTIMSLVDQKIPPTLNLNEPDTIEKSVETFFQHASGNRALVPKSDIQMAVSNSFGFGGTNASLVFRRYNE